MLLKILRYIFGYIKAEVYGFAPERFMNLIVKNDVVIWDIEHTKQGYIFHTGRKNLMKMKPFLQKTNMKIKIMEKRGLPYFFKNHKKRVAFLLGFAIASVLLYIMSLFVWEIKVSGENTLVADNVLKQIEKNYVALGTLKSHVNCHELEEKLRKDFAEISWVSCELKGTGLTIYLEEGMAPKKKTEDTPGDMVALKDAVITKMVTRQGTPVVKVKDTVKKGEILISGTVYIYDDNNEILETSYIAADGDVYGNVKENYEDFIDLKYYKKIYDKNIKNYVSFYFMDYCFTPYIPKVNSKNYDTYTEIHKACILDHFYLPMGYKKMTKRPYQLQLKQYDEKEAKDILTERMNKKIKAFEKKGVEIIKNDVTIVRENDKLVAKGTITLNESITVLQSSSTKNHDKTGE